MPKYLLILSFLLCLATGCERGAEDDMAGRTPVAFTARTDGEEATRAGVITNDNLASMGVFASYTGQNDLQPTSSKPDFMYNQPVGKTSGVWTYSPVKYWPNTTGDKISFFAYAPHTDKVSGLTVATGNTTAGYPKLNYTVPAAAASQTDLLAAVPLLLTKGDDVAFRMGHALTHVLFRLKTTSDVTVTRLEVKGGKSQGQLAFHTSGYTWTSLSGTTTFTGATGGVSVTANTTTEIANFFLLPSNAASLELTFTESGTTQVETVDLPASPLWEMNKTVAYTLNIENKTQITLDVKSWDSSSVEGTMGEEPSGTYPFALNGVVYESATKFYYVGALDYSGWYDWYETVDRCKSKYSSGPYQTYEWRLPTVSEMENIIRLGFPSSTLWTSTEIGSDNAYRCTNYNGFSSYNTPKNNAGGRVMCIRDIGTITPPTIRHKEQINILYSDASTTYDVISIQKGQQSGWITYAAAEKYCSDGRWAGYSDWRLPTLSEARMMMNWGPGVLLYSQVWTSTVGETGKHYAVNENGGNAVVDDSGANGHTFCVRKY